MPPSCPPLPGRLIDIPLVEPYGDEGSVGFGHYWRSWPDLDHTDRSACVDYSAVKGGPLVAYRWSDDGSIDHARFVTSM